MASGNILIVEDERHNLLILERMLTFRGYQVSAVSSGEDAVALPKPDLFDVAILDLNLGQGISGMEVLAYLRETAPETIIILLTGNGTLETAVEALRQGAHDYLLKPAKSQEINQSIERGLKIRKKRLEQKKREAVLSQLEQNLEESLNRLRGESNHSSDTTELSKTVTPIAQKKPLEIEHENRYLLWGNIQVDLLRHQITINGRSLNLSPTEYALIIYLITEAPRIIAPQELVRQIQGYSIDQEEASPVIRTHIYRLRRKIKAVVPDKELIHTVRGIGYTIEK